MDAMSRRDLLGSASVVGGWLAVGGSLAAAQDTRPAAPPAPSGSEGPYRLAPLPYSYSDLEPYIDTQTMKLHHDIHHAGYVRGANAALAELERIRRDGGESIHAVRAITANLTFNVAGHVLHDVFWRSMKKGGGGEPPADSAIAAAIERDFGSFAAFKAQFSAAAVQVQGSGWAVLVYEPLAKRLLVTQAEKHENCAAPGAAPLLPLDVWEHAYYLNYQNRRADYIKAFFEVIDWTAVDAALKAATA